MKKGFIGIMFLLSMGLVSAQDAGIFGSSLLKNYILPFLLVFVLIFAILQKAKILGDGKAQIDALVSLSIALILIAFPQPRDLIVNLVPWLAVGVVVILAFLILYGFAAEEEWKENKFLKITLGILGAIFILAVVAYVSGFWGWFYSQLVGGGSSVFSSIIIFVVVGAAVAAAIATGHSKKEDK